MNDKKLVIFDLDGTLLDTLDDLHASVNHALLSEGFPERSIDEIRRFVGNGVRKLVERAVGPDCEHERLERTFAEFKRHYTENCMELTGPYEGIRELLCELKQKGFLLGVVSNKADEPVKLLIEHYFPGVFDSVVGEREGVRRKPAPDSVLETAKNLGCDVGKAVYVGDSDVDGQTAVNAGCRCVLVSWGFRGRDTLTPFGVPIADAPCELTELIETEVLNEA